MECDRCKAHFSFMDLLPSGKASRFDLNGERFNLCADCVDGMIFVMTAYAQGLITLDNRETEGLQS